MLYTFIFQLCYTKIRYWIDAFRNWISVLQLHVLLDAHFHLSHSSRHKLTQIARLVGRTLVGPTKFAVGELKRAQIHYVLKIEDAARSVMIFYKPILSISAMHV